MLLPKRRFLATAAGAGVTATIARAQGLPSHEQALYDAAKKEGELTCRYCDLQGLCRISERSTVPTFDEGEGGRMPGEGA